MIINVKVHSNSKKQKIDKLSEDSYLIYLKKPAEDNKANLELLKLLKKNLKTEVKIIKGFKSRNKIIEIKNANKI
ncbi:MAG: DUF167 family protein [Nanoarchaeota archaeon]